MVKLADKKTKTDSTLVHLTRKKDLDAPQQIGENKDYRKLLEDKIKKRNPIQN